MSAFPRRLDYNAGLENAPGDPFGRTELSLEPDGSARLTHKHVGEVRTWTAKVDVTTLQTLWDALERGGFPTIPPHRIPGGSAMRTLVAHVGDAQQTGHVAWNSAKDLAGYSDAFPILDSIVRQISEDTVQAAPNTLPPCVTDIVRSSAN
jgi:hypothetical protein